METIICTVRGPGGAFDVRQARFPAGQGYQWSVHEVGTGRQVFLTRLGRDLAEKHARYQAA